MKLSKAGKFERITKLTASEIRGLIPFYKKTVVWNEEDQCFIARTPEIQGCTTHGDSEEEALKHLNEAIEISLLANKKMKESFPYPAAKKPEPKGFPLRLKKGMYTKIKSIADDEGRSMNDYLLSLIERGLSRNS